MLYLLLALTLIISGGGLYLYSVYKKQILPKSSKIMFAVFVVLGTLMASFALQEISPDQYKNVDAFTAEYPSLISTVEKRRPTLQMYEYLEIVEAYKALKREALD